MRTCLATTFVELIRTLREAKGLTKENLADLAGIHRTTVGLLENGSRLPSLQLANSLAYALNIPLNELIQEAELILQGRATAQQLSLIHINRTPKLQYIRNSDLLYRMTGLEPKMLLNAIDSCYKTLDLIDEQLISKNSVPLAQLVELANLSSMVGNMIGGGLAENSEGLYMRNRPHTYPDLIPLRPQARNLEIKMALETNRPKGHLPKAGTYITFRYILGDKYGMFNRGKEFRGDTVWIWEVKIGEIKEEDFLCSNTAGDSGKTAIIKSEIFNAMPLVYYNENHVPYAKRSSGGYVGFN